MLHEHFPFSILHFQLNRRQQLCELRTGERTLRLDRAVAEALHQTLLHTQCNRISAVREIEPASLTDASVCAVSASLMAAVPSACRRFAKSCIASSRVMAAVGRKLSLRPSSRPFAYTALTASEYTRLPELLRAVRRCRTDRADARWSCRLRPP